MDNELESLAALTLRNAFWYDFSALVNAYLVAAEGLDVELQKAQMGELTSIYGRFNEATGGAPPEILAMPGDVKHRTILDALDSEATSIYLCGKEVFERRDGEWYFIGDE